MAAAPDAALIARIADVAPGTTISATPADTASGLARLDAALRLAGRLGLALAIALAVASLHFAGRLAVAPAGASLRTLAILGERPRTLARRAPGIRAALAAGAGALLGTGVALPLVLLAAAGQPSPPCIAALAATPPLCAAIAGLFAGLRARDAATGRAA